MQTIKPKSPYLAMYEAADRGWCKPTVQMMDFIHSTEANFNSITDVEWTHVYMLSDRRTVANLNTVVQSFNAPTWLGPSALAVVVVAKVAQEEALELVAKDAVNDEVHRGVDWHEQIAHACHLVDEDVEHLENVYHHGHDVEDEEDSHDAEQHRS